jgi:tRNA threonylcarbamoyladenosine biosynthesis protein TsaB
MSNTGFKADGAELLIPAPIILAIDTSSPEASLAISSAENIIATLTIRDNRPHSQTLFSQIETLLRLAEIKIQDVSAFAIASGPGSFTGLRVGLAAVKGLADSLNTLCLGVNSLDLLALASGFDGAHLIIISAGRDEIYCGFRDLSSGDIVGGSIADQVGEPSFVLRAMTQYLRQSPLIITVDGRCKYKKEIFDLIRQMQVDLADASGSQLIFSIPTLNTSAVLAQRASVLIKKNKIGPVKPHYIRQSDAEIKWKL